MSNQQKPKNNVIQLNKKLDCFCKTWPVSAQDHAGAHHHSLCSHYKTDKYPYLLAQDPEDEAWVVVPIDFLQFICDGLEDNQAQAIKFMRSDMSDEEVFKELEL